MRYLASAYQSLPLEPGVYVFKNNAGEILYVGKALRLRNRVSSYFQNQNDLAEKTKAMVLQVATIETTVVESELEALLLEANLIKKYSPKFNVRLRDGKNYPLIQITKRAKFPAVVTARKIEDKQSIYFGPYPSSSAMYHVLKLLRRIFPFHSTRNHLPRTCLYYHIGLCPCIPAVIKHADSVHAEESIKEYKKTIRHIVDFLNGKTKKVLKDLEKERDNASKTEQFEHAAKLQKQIDAIIYVCQPIHKPFEYEINPNLRSDLRHGELRELQEILVKNGLLIDFPSRIECYDNSNIQGTNPVSSMVVLINGEIDKSQYRKFKIKKIIGPNDFDTMKEVLERRLKHTEWPFPQLIVVDGGKGQVSAAKNVLQQFQIPLIGLAKREETIITSDLKEIHLPKSTKALQLIMKIRDEAHRFAITFHRSLRSKNSLPTSL